MHKVLLEICVDNIASAIAAKEGGADRLEVCASLATGGTTPSHGFIEQCAAETDLPLMVMIRPHDGDFVYSDADVSVMLSDIAIAKALSVQGVVFGALKSSGEIDAERIQRLVAAARPMEVTFHRAFDVCADSLGSLELLIELGVDRLLTSGQAATAEEGSELIRTLVDKSQGRIAIVAGAAVNVSNAAAIVRATGVRELHASASQASARPRTSNVSFGADHRVTSAAIVRDLKTAVS